MVLVFYVDEYNWVDNIKDEKQAAWLYEMYSKIG